MRRKAHPSAIVEEDRPEVNLVKPKEFTRYAAADTIAGRIAHPMLERFRITSRKIVEKCERTRASRIDDRTFGDRVRNRDGDHWDEGTETYVEWIG